MANSPNRGSLRKAMLHASNRRFVVRRLTSWVMPQWRSSARIAAHSAFIGARDPSMICKYRFPPATSRPVISSRALLARAVSRMTPTVSTVCGTVAVLK
ncbi:MAG: hypothetical protein WKF52_03325 [Sphingomicrobium sp.]